LSILTPIGVTIHLVFPDDRLDGRHCWQAHLDAEGRIILSIVNEVFADRQTDRYLTVDA